MMNTKQMIERRRGPEPGSRWGRRDTDFYQIVPPGDQAGEYMIIARNHAGDECWRGRMPTTWRPLPGQ